MRCSGVTNAHPTVDNFKSACVSCHSTAENNLKHEVPMVPDPEPGLPYMAWFRNLLRGESFSGGSKWTADYSLQLMQGYYNYLDWKSKVNGLTHKVKMVVPFSVARREAAVLEAKRRALRAEDVSDGDDEDSKK